MSGSFSDEEKNSSFSSDSNLHSSSMSEITSSENSDSFTQTSNEKNNQHQLSDAPHQNLPVPVSSKKIKQKLARKFGMGTISFLKDEQNAELIQKLMKKKSKFFEQKEYREEFEKMKFTLQDLQKWVKEKKLHKKYVKFETFRYVWGFHLLPNNAISLEDRFFCSVLKRITKHYLNHKFYQSIFNKVTPEAKSKSKALCYLEKSYILARGLKHPENIQE